MTVTKDCIWEHEDCLNAGDMCLLCNSDSFYYKPEKKKTPRMSKGKITKRQGSLFEANNHDDNVEVLSEMTPNSGAGGIKGDEQINGYIKIMEELKTTTKKNEGRQPGEQSFSIRKEWLDKLEREAVDENMEFWYLKFAFKNEDHKYYVVVDKDVIMSMVRTMTDDRAEKRRTEAAKKVIDKKIDYLELKNSELIAENDYLKAQIEQLNLQLKLKK